MIDISHICNDFQEKREQKVQCTERDPSLNLRESNTFYRVLPFNAQWSPKTLLWLALLGLCLSLGIFGFLSLGLGVFKLILVVKYEMHHCYYYNNITCIL